MCVRTIDEGRHGSRTAESVFGSSSRGSFRRQRRFASQKWLARSGSPESGCYMFTWPRAATTTTTTTTELAVGSCAGLVSFDCDEGNSELRGARPRGSRPFVLHSVIASFLLDAFVNAPVCRCGVKKQKTWKKDLEERLGSKTWKKDLQERLARKAWKKYL